MPESVNHRDEPDHDWQPRIPGRSRGHIEISDDFDAPAHDIEFDAPAHDIEAEIYSVSD